jgi:hypothetical protein
VENKVANEIFRDLLKNTDFDKDVIRTLEYFPNIEGLFTDNILTEDGRYADVLDDLFTQWFLGTRKINNDFSLLVDVSLGDSFLVASTVFEISTTLLPILPLNSILPETKDLGKIDWDRQTPKRILKIARTIQTQSCQIDEILEDWSDLGLSEAVGNAIRDEIKKFAKGFDVIDSFFPSENSVQVFGADKFEVLKRGQPSLDSLLTDVFLRNMHMLILNSLTGIKVVESLQSVGILLAPLIGHLTVEAVKRRTERVAENRREQLDGWMKARYRKVLSRLPQELDSEGASSLRNWLAKK